MVEIEDENEADLGNGTVAVIGTLVVGVEIEMNVVGAGIEMTDEATVIETIATAVPTVLTIDEGEEVTPATGETDPSIQDEVEGTVGKELQKHPAHEMR